MPGGDCPLVIEPCENGGELPGTLQERYTPRKHRTDSCVRLGLGRDRSQGPRRGKGAEGRGSCCAGNQTASGGSVASFLMGGVYR